MSVRVEASVELRGISQSNAFQAMVDPAAQQRWMIATRLYPVQTPIPVPHVGSRLAAFTGLGGVGFLDTMTVTGYRPPDRWEVDKDGGLIRGTGTMRVQPTADGSRASWTNELILPCGAVGRLGFAVVKPFVELALRACLRRLARRLRSGVLPLRAEPVPERFPPEGGS